MKKFKLFILFALILTMLSACAHMTETNTTPSVLDTITERGELLVGTTGNQPPFNMTDKNGVIFGFEADLARYMAEGLGVKLKMVPMNFSELLAALENGKVDMILSDMTITAERNKKVIFVGPYFVSGKSILTKRETLANAKDTVVINSPDTILTALKGSTSQIFVEKVIPKAKLVLADDYDQAINMVLQDKVHALVAEYPFCVLSVLRHPEEGLASVVTPLTFEPIGIALAAGDPLMVNWVDNFMGMVAGSGELKLLKKQWFGSASWLERLK